VPRRHASLATRARYLTQIVGRFRVTLCLLGAAVLVGAILIAATPLGQLGGRPPSFGTALYASWMALFAEGVLQPETVTLRLVCAVYPLLGFGLVGEGVVRLGMLMVSREHGEQDWMKVMAHASRDHVVLCGLGHLGMRTLQQLVGAGQGVVAIEKDPACRFLNEARATGCPILVRDARDDQALADAQVAAARVIIIATSDDMANLEIALDARRLNAKIRVLMRLFDQRLADKLKAAGLIDEAFSTSALAAPVVAKLATG
jgi:voltage-gated potassium channel